jgi:3-oxoadipate enol-lactonase
MKRAAGIVYAESGSAGLPILCLHGIGGNSGSFVWQLTGLGNRRVIALNLPGYGGSDKCDPLSFAALADRIAGFMDALSIPRAHLLGQSIGGMIALETGFLHPDRVASLALIGTTAAFGGRDDSFRDQFIVARLKPLDEGKTLADLALSFVPEITGPIASKQAITSATASMAMVPEETYRAIIRCLVTFNRREDIARLNLPVCLIAGSFDRNAPARTMARMAEKIPGAEFHEVKGAGHLINLEAPEETNAILQKFYAKHGA